MKTKIFAACVLSVVAMAATTASASILATVSYGDATGNSDGIAMSSSDLGDSATVTASQPGKWGSSEANLIDGLKYSTVTPPPASLLYETETGYVATNGDSVTMTLAANSTGYDLSRIDVLSGFAADRVVHNYAIDVWAKGASSWASLYTTGGDLGNHAPQQEGAYLSTARENLVCLEDSAQTGLAIATGVEKLRFTFFDISGTGGFGGGAQTCYREIDVFGVSSVPEPSTIVLVLTGMLGLLAYAWRKRK